MTQNGSTNGVAPSFAGVCDVCKCAFDTKGRRIRCLTVTQAELLDSTRGEKKKRGMCLTCWVTQVKAARLRKEKLDNRVSGVKNDEYQEPGLFGEEEGGLR